MEQYIRKSALIAEIEKAIDSPAPSHDPQCPWEDGYWCGLYTAEGIIDALEVKGVDLDKECRKYLTEHFNVYEDGILQSKRSGTPLDTFDVIQVAKHFFELGLKTKGE